MFLFQELLGLCNEDGSKSHLWADEDVIPTHGQGEKLIKNGIAYSAPGIKYCKHEIITHRPDVKTGDFMIFNPKCVHGGR